jgi:ATP-dependent RNA helicase RhlE
MARPACWSSCLKAEPIDRALVFTRTKHGADKVVKSLQNAGIASDAIHGNKSQNQRERALGTFRSGKVRVLVATDIAARGIDVDGVSHVINFDMPNIPESYVHRIGRTARAGAEGIAISFVANDERAFLRDIERLTKISIPSTDRRLNPSIGEPKGESRGCRNGQSQDRNKGRNRNRRGKNPHRGQGPRDDQRPRPEGERNQEQHAGDRQQRSQHNGERKHEQRADHRAPRPHNGERKHEGRPEHRSQRPHQHSKSEPRQHNNNRNNQTQPKAENGGQLTGVAFMNRKPKRRGGHQQPHPAQN